MNNIITLRRLTDILSSATSTDHESAEKFILEFTNTVAEGLASDGIVKIKGLGTFSRNESSGKIEFKAERELADAINAPFAFFTPEPLADNVSADMLEGEIPNAEPVGPTPEIPEAEPVQPQPELPKAEPFEMDPEIPEAEPVQPQPEVPEAEPFEMDPEIPEAEPVQPQPEVPGAEPFEMDPEIPEAEPVQPQPEVPEAEPFEMDPEIPEAEPVQPQPEVPEAEPFEMDPEIPEPEPVQPQPEVPEAEDTNVPPYFEPISDETDQTQTKRKSVLPWFWMSVILVGGALFGFCIGYFGHDSISTHYFKVASDTLDLTNDDDTFKVAPPVSQSASTAYVDTTDTSEEVITTNEPVETPAIEEKQTVSEPIAETKPAETNQPVYDTVTPNRTLTKMARDHYGNKYYWAYIYMENTDIIDNPNNIRAGTRLRIPPKSKYDVSTDESVNLEAAKKKVSEILKKYP